MLKLVILFLVLFNAALAFSQGLHPASVGYNEIIVPIGGSYTYPSSVLYFFPKKEGLELFLENGFLVIKNPKGNTNVDIEIIRQDGSADNIKILNSSRLSIVMKLEERLRGQVVANKNIAITYSTGYSTTQLSQNGEDAGRLISKTNQFRFKNKINADNIFKFNFREMSTEFFNKDKNYKQFYDLTYQYKNAYFEHGFLQSNPRSSGINRGGSIWLNRLAYKDRNWFMAATEGNNREFVSENDQIYGFNLAYEGSDFSLGTYVFSNPEKQIQNPSIDGTFRLDRFVISGQLTFNQDRLNDKNSLNYNYSLSYSPRIEFVKRVYYNQTSIQNGVYDPIYGSVSDTALDIKTVGTTLGLLSKKNKKKQDMTISLNYLNITTDSSYAQSGSFTYAWNISRLNFGLIYAYSENESLYPVVENSTTTYSPSLSFTLSPKGSKRTRTITVSDSVSKSSSGITTDFLRLSYGDKSSFDRYQFSITKRTQKQDFNDIQNDIFSLGASASFILSTRWQYGLGANTTFSNIGDRRIRRDNRENVGNESEFDLTNYGYSSNVTYKPSLMHTFSLRGSQGYVNKFGFNTRSTTIGLNYVFNYVGDWKTPLNYIVNNRSLKLHFFEDTNFNGKFDKGEKLLTNLSVKIKSSNGAIERKVTDSDGYVRFSGLARVSYQILPDSELGQVLDSQRILNLSDDSITTEIGLGKSRNIILQVFDYNIDQTVSGSFYYDIKCPTVGYNRKVSSVGLSSLRVSIPRVEDCSASLDPTQFNQYFEEIDLDEKKIGSSSEIIFNIKQVNKIDLAIYLDSNRDGKLSSDEIFTGKDIFVEYKNKKFFAKDGTITVVIDEKLPKETVFLNEILKISPKYFCDYKRASYPFKDKAFQRFSTEITCSLKK